MPPKATVRLGEQRAWGSRYDSLNASSSSLSPSVVDSGSPELSTSTGRSWADDEVIVSTSSRAPQASIPTSTADAASNASSQTGDSMRMPHDASVFIGSLPSNLNESELICLLIDHLSHFADIQNVKIVHDAKGGICAFVQCENASQAACIITQNRLSPRPFMGRYLRYEAARAFRSLLISFRKPTEFALRGRSNNFASYVETEKNRVPGHVNDPDLPGSIRIWRPSTARYPLVLYGSEALTFDGSHPEFEDGLFIEQLRFDAEDIRKIATIFGPLESMAERDQSLNHLSQEGNSDILGPQPFSGLRTPSPHEDFRSSGMDKHIWEVKWRHRDDCVTALMTLRRVPCLNVTWAHQHGHMPSTVHNDLSRSKTTPQLQRDFSPTINHSSVIHGPSTADLVYNKNTSLGPLTSIRAYKGTVLRTPAHQANSFYNKSLIPFEIKPIGGRYSHVAKHGTVMRNSLLSTHRGNHDAMVSKNRSSSLEWSASDFPPLQPRQDNEESNNTAWGKCVIDCESLTPSRGRRSTLADSSHASTLLDTDDPTGVHCPLVKQKFIQRRSMSHPTRRTQNCESIPQTPELANSPLTPKTSSVSSGFPQTPYNSTVPLPDCHDEERESKAVGRGYFEGNRDIDKQTIFVGGLETFGPNTWDEEKLSNVFRQYGLVDSVKIIRPINKKSAFAFVKFADEDSPIRAIQGEHNRVYNGRTIRVQLRDNQPFRVNWKSRGRSLARAQLNEGGVTDNKSLRKSMSGDREKSVDITSSKEEHCVRPDSGMRLDRSITANPFGSRNISEMNINSADAQRSNAHSGSVATMSIKTEDRQVTPAHTISSAAHTMPPQEPSAPSGGSVAAQTLVPAVYYNGQGWILPYGQGVTHTVPISSYSAILAPPANQVSAVGGNNSVQWGNMFHPTFPYPSYSYFPATTAEEVTSITTDDSRKPPVSPAGFIQGEMGALIPVYPPDALNHYLSCTAPGQLSTSSLQGQTPASFVPPHGILHPTAQWHNFHHPSQFYSYPIASSAISSTFSPITQQSFVQPHFNGQAFATGQASWASPLQMTSVANPTHQPHQSPATSPIPPIQHVQTQGWHGHPSVIPNFPVRNAIAHGQRSRHYFNRQSLGRDSMHLTHNRNNNFGNSIRSSQGAPGNIPTVGSETHEVSRSREGFLSSDSHP